MRSSWLNGRAVSASFSQRDWFCFCFDQERCTPINTTTTEFSSAWRFKVRNQSRTMRGANKLIAISCLLIILVFNCQAGASSLAPPEDLSRRSIQSPDEVDTIHLQDNNLDLIPRLLASASNSSTANIKRQSSSPSLDRSINQRALETRSTFAASRTRRSPGNGAGGGGGGQFNSVAPKLIQWSRDAVQYYEGSTLVLSCSLSLSGGEQPVKFAWFKNGKPLGGQATGAPSSGPGASSGVPVVNQQHQRLSIETLADYSFLRLAELRPSDSGAYTCAASNSLGQEDRTTTQVLVNVKLKWISNTNQDRNSRDDNESNSTLPASDQYQMVKSRAGQSIVFECNASGGQPRPRVRWYRLVPTGGAPFAKTLGGGGGDGHLAAGPQVSTRTGLEPMHSPLDEVQIRTTLAQLKSMSRADSFSFPFRRYELINRSNNDAPQQHLDKTPGSHSGAMNGSATSGQLQFKWRVETSTSSAGSSGDNQHEIYSRLILDRVELGAAGFYECDVSSSIAFAGTAAGFSSDQHTSTSAGLAQNQDNLSSLAHLLPVQQQAQANVGGEKLRRLFGLLVNGWSSQVWSSLD